ERVPLAGLGIEHQQRVRVAARRPRHVLAEPRRVPQVDPVVVLEVGRHVRALERRAVGAPELPALVAVAAVTHGLAAQDLALAPVEARHVAAAGERRPDDAVTVDVEPARAEAGLRHAIQLADARLGRIRPPIHAHEIARTVRQRRPRDVLLAGRRARLHAVHLAADARVARGIERLVRLVPRLRDPAVAVRVDHDRAPALRRLLVAGLLELPRV